MRQPQAALFRQLVAAEPLRRQLAERAGTAVCATSPDFSTATNRPFHTSSSCSDDPFGQPPAQEQRRVVVTGIGLATPLGVGVATNWKRLIAGHTAVRALNKTDLPDGHAAAFDQLPCKVVAMVPQQELEVSEHLPPQDTRRHTRSMTLALCAASEALHDAEWMPVSGAAQRASGVSMGSGISCTADMAEAGVLLDSGKLRRLSPFFIPRVLLNMPAGLISMSFGLQGPCHSTSTACAAGAHAIGDAFQMVRRGDADVMVAGGTESCIDAVSLGGFSRLRALSTGFNDTPGAASRPFDVSRDGFVMGEGAGVLVLEELGHAMDRGACVYAEVRGYGLSGDAYHMTQPPADGRGAALAMSRALAQAGLKPEQISYINAHATSTPIGDDVEQQAIADVFGELATCSSGGGGSDGSARLAPLAVSSTKGATGHLLGAAGAVEAAYSVLALARRVAPPTVNLQQHDPPLLSGLVTGEAGGRTLGPGPLAVMSNSFGFGGTNTSLCFTSPPTPVG